MKPGRVTGADVARAAGVSPATVSYVMNDTAGQTIPETTRKRVLAEASRLGYVPQMAGRMLRRGRSDLIVWLLPDWPIGSTIGAIIEQLSREASRRGYTIAIVREGDGPRRLEASVRMLAPAAILAMHTVPRSIATYAASAGIPIANAMGSESASDLDQYGHVADEEYGSMQVQYLAAKGHERIAYLYPDDARIAEFANGRLEGARSAAKSLGLPTLRKRTGPLDRVRLGNIARDWCDAGVTAVCAYNDEWALGLLSGMHRVGLSAPADLAVIGMDNGVAAPLASPPLTSIDQDIASYVVTLMNRIEAALGVKTAPQSLAVRQRPFVVERESA